MGLVWRINFLKKRKSPWFFSGDGASSEGDFHEGLNVAAVWKLPVIFVVEHNGYGLSTPSEEQFAFKYFTEKGPGYGMEAVRVQGNNVLDVYDTILRLAQDIRENPRPVLSRRSPSECVATRKLPARSTFPSTSRKNGHNSIRWTITKPIWNL
ncbi:thiamine pyrophosphate-dependent enzyme [Algoriphagus boritolerans]|uniref:thiamine pyrophosphate-dependent enzyme n=1 Tax=Algoriphagus boritolerans TaxID=308111 RepID=UPI002FCE0509